MTDSLWYLVRRLYRWCKLARCRHLVRRAIARRDLRLGRRAVAAAVRLRAEMEASRCG